jgi:hypothetical protein
MLLFHYIPNFLFFNFIFNLSVTPYSQGAKFKDLAGMSSKILSNGPPGGLLTPHLLTRGFPSPKIYSLGYASIHYIINIMEATDRWVKAGTVENRFEGDRISQALQEAGIPFLIKSFLDTAYDGLYIPQKGWGVVMVSQKNREEAEKLINEVKKSFMREGEDETGQLG